MSRWLSWRVPTSYSIETTNAGFCRLCCKVRSMFLACADEVIE